MRAWEQYTGLRGRAKKLNPEVHNVDRLYKNESSSGRKKEFGDSFKELHSNVHIFVNSTGKQKERQDRSIAQE